jgi:phosphonate transport system substrate-binding protein
MDYTVYETEKKAGKVDESKVIVIWETPTFPDYQFTIRGDVDATFGTDFKEKVREAILSLEDKEILGFFARSKFIPASNDQYKPIAEVAAATKLD